MNEKRKSMREGVLAFIGNTPLVRLDRVLGETGFQLYSKLEATNPGGSIKDRTALSIIEAGLEQDKLQIGDTVIESSSGNMGIGLAQVCAYLGLNFICVVDPKTTTQNIEILRAYGAQVEMVTESDARGVEFLQARLDRVEDLLRAIPGSFWPNQYANTSNPHAHHQTMQEITNALHGKVDYLFCATSTCGTIRGCAEYIKENKLRTKVMAVDAYGSVIFGGPKAKRLIPGHGAAVRPKLFQEDMAEGCIYISDLECVIGCRRLVRMEAILAGGSSGAVLMAVWQIQNTIPTDANCVMIFPDRGERYLDTIYSDRWVKKHFGDVSHLWQEPELLEETCLTASY
jgi:cysteine synthase A